MLSFNHGDLGPPLAHRGCALILPGRKVAWMVGLDTNLIGLVGPVGNWGIDHKDHGKMGKFIGYQQNGDLMVFKGLFNGDLSG